MFFLDMTVNGEASSNEIVEDSNKELQRVFHKEESLQETVMKRLRRSTRT